MTPDYTALEMKARFYASRRRASGGYTLAEFLEESADALALAASLQEEKDELAGYLSRARETGHQMADAIAQLKAEKVALQNEIERLKGYVRHAPDCLFGAPRMLSGSTGTGAYLIQDGVHRGCSCGLAPETGAT